LRAVPSLQLAAGQERKEELSPEGGLAAGQNLNPQPSTLNPQPSTLNPQPSTLNPQP